MVRTFVDTMMARGTDQYGPVRSPLFAATLNLDTMALPKLKTVAKLPLNRDGHVYSIGYGLPDPPVGIRPGDRSPQGNNLEHDIMLLRTMYELSRVTGDSRYAAFADSILRFWLFHCQSPATGLMASGEHISWDFVHENANGDLYEVFRRFPFYDKLYAIDTWRALRNADALFLSQIGNKMVGDFSRHAGYESFAPDTGCALPRHAGFYIWAYANAYAQSRDPKYIDRIELLIESRTGKRPQPYSLLVRPGRFEPAASAHPTLRALLWDAAELVPSRREAWRKIVRELDEQAFRGEGGPINLGYNRDGKVLWGNPEFRSGQPRGEPGRSEAPTAEAEKLARQYPSLVRFGRAVSANGQTRSTTLSRLWRLEYGGSGPSGDALRDYYRYLQCKDARFLRDAEEATDRYLEEGFPKVTHDLWPSVTGQVISLCLALSGEKAVPAAKRERYAAFAREVADRAIPLFSKNGLFRADGAAGHYEAITGADDLVWALLQLHCALNRPDHPIGFIDTNF
ncbi:MAG: hypothetical protein ACE15B_19710 [Bryobacteraceae bacterium]